MSWVLATITGTAAAWAWIGWRISRAQRTAVYRFYDSKGRLLYVGMTNSPRFRFAQHAADKWWWVHVDPLQTRIAWYRTRAIAATVERWEIRRLDPACNKKGRRRGARVWCGPDAWYIAA